MFFRRLFCHFVYLYIWWHLFLTALQFEPVWTDTTSANDMCVFRFMCVCMRSKYASVLLCARAKKECGKKGFSTCIECANKLVRCVCFIWFCFVFGTTTVWCVCVCVRALCDLLCFSPSLPWLYTKTVAHMHSRFNSCTNLATFMSLFDERMNKRMRKQKKNNIK